MGDCDRAATGSKVKKNWLVFCSETTCVNLQDPATMAQLKALLGQLTGERAADYTTLWTAQDAALLGRWARQSAVNLPGWFQGALFAGDQSPYPNGNTVRALLIQAGYPDEPDLYRFYPALTRAFDAFNDSSCSVLYFEATEPAFGEADRPPEVGTEPTPEPEVPDWVEASQRGPLWGWVGYGLALAGVAGIVTIVWRGRRR